MHEKTLKNTNLEQEPGVNARRASGDPEERTGRASRGAVGAVASFLPFLLFGLIVAIFGLDRGLFERLVAKDDAGGFIEHGTVLVLLVAIPCGVVALARSKGVVPPLARGFHAMWVLGCIYFAGEEASWGQWYFGWETPETFKELNNQDETNLHNMSSWLDQKPRFLVELWIIGGGLVLPLVRWWRRQRWGAGEWAYWVYPTLACVPVAAVLAIIKLGAKARFFDKAGLGNSELAEFFTAYFFLVYFSSVLSRVVWERKRSIREPQAG